MANTISLGDLVIRLKGDGKDLDSALKRAGKTLSDVGKDFAKLGKHGLNVLSQNNKEFKELHDVLGDVGIGIGFAADAIAQMTGQGNLGLIDMAKNTRILGHSLKTWATAGAFAWESAFDEIKTKSKIAWLQITEDIGGSLRELGKTVGENKALKLLVPNLELLGKLGEKFAGQTKDNTEEIMKLEAERAKRRAGFEREIQDILKDDPEPAKPAKGLGDSVEKEVRQAKAALRSLDPAVMGKSEVAGFLAFSELGGPGRGTVKPGTSPGRSGFRGYGVSSFASDIAESKGGEIKINGKVVSSKIGSAADAESALRARLAAPGIGPNNIRSRQNRTDAEWQRDLASMMPGSFRGYGVGSIASSLGLETISAGGAGRKSSAFSGGAIAGSAVGGGSISISAQIGEKILEELKKGNAITVKGNTSQAKSARAG